MPKRRVSSARRASIRKKEVDDDKNENTSETKRGSEEDVISSKSENDDKDDGSEGVSIGEQGSVDLQGAAKQRQESSDNPGKTSSTMARAYEKYDESLKDTPKHLYGFDKAMLSSDEDGEIDVQGPTTASTGLISRIKETVKEYWRYVFHTVSFFILCVFIAFVFQVYITHSLPTKPVQNDVHSDALRKIEEKVDRLSSALQAIANITDHSPSENQQSVSEAAVQQIVQQALERYNADKVGMADFAMESSGAEIHGSYHSPAYDVGSARVVLFGIPLWFDIKPPRVILQPDNSPGNCWAFKGTNGFVVIKLSKTLVPTAFSVEHIPKLLSPTGDGRIPSAPKEFTVWGWRDPLGQEKIKLGYFVYNNEGDFLQTFDVQFDGEVEAVQYVELRVLSNHGNPEYTCIYRFRVHGTPQS